MDNRMSIEELYDYLCSPQFLDEEAATSSTTTTYTNILPAMNTRFVSRFRSSKRSWSVQRTMSMPWYLTSLRCSVIIFARKSLATSHSWRTPWRVIRFILTL